MGFDPPEDDDPLADPFGGDPLEDPFAPDPFEAPAGRETERDADLERAISESDPATLRVFIVVAVLAHAGLFGVSFGAMLIGFRGQWAVGGALAIGGLLAIGLAIVRYRRYRDQQ